MESETNYKKRISIKTKRNINKINKMIKTMQNSDDAVNDLIKANKIIPMDVNTAEDILNDDANGLEVENKDNEASKVRHMADNISDSDVAVKDIAKAEKYIPIVVDTAKDVLYDDIDGLKVKREDQLDI